MKKLLMIPLLIGIILFVIHKLGLIEALNDLELMRKIFSDLGFMGYFAFIAVSVPVAVFSLPGPLLAVIAGITYGGFKGGLLTLIGATVGSSISFLLGKRLARGYVLRKFGDNPLFQKIEEGVKENGVSFLILTRLVPLFPYGIQSYAYALTPMGLGTFTLVSFLTMLPACFIYAYLASEIVVNGFSLKIMLELALAGVLLFMISFVPKWVAKKKKIKLE